MSKSAEALVRRFESRISAFFRNRARSAEDEEDLVQTALLAVFQSWDRFEGRSSESTWVYSICGNVLKKYYRDQRVRRIHESYLETAEPADRRYRELSRRDDLIALKGAAAELPEPLKTICELYYTGDRKVREIAADLRIPEGTVKYCLYQIRKELKRRLI